MKLSEAITREELRAFSEASDMRAFLETAWHLSLIVAAFALVIVWPNPLTAMLAVLLLAGRQQAAGVIGHDCAHRAFFRTPWLNEVVGQWIVGGAIHLPLAGYRDVHLKHHKHAGTDDDPDLWMVDKYPVEPASFRRKIIRDVTGQTGVRDVFAKFRNPSWSAHGAWAAFHVALLVGLFAANALWAYPLWWVAEIFVYPLIFRLRQIAEHGVAAKRDSLDPRDNTNTTLVSWWERLFIAPANVNYHLEHHLFAATPPYRLAEVHKMLADRGYYKDHDCISRGYADVIRRAVRTDDARAQP